MVSSLLPGSPTSIKTPPKHTILQVLEEIAASRASARKLIFDIPIHHEKLTESINSFDPERIVSFADFEQVHEEELRLQELTEELDKTWERIKDASNQLRGMLQRVQEYGLRRGLVILFKDETFYNNPSFLVCYGGEGTHTTEYIVERLSHGDKPERIKRDSGRMKPIEVLLNDKAFLSKKSLL
jgi:hypothetical protein